MLHIKAGTFIYLHILNSFYSENCKQQASNAEGWCEHWDLTVKVISLSYSNETSLYANFLCDWPSADHWLVNRAVRPERYSHLHWVVGNNLAGPIIRPSPSTIASLHDITGTFTSCGKSHRPQSHLRLLQNSFVSTTSKCRSKFFHSNLESPHWLSPRDVIIYWWSFVSIGNIPCCWYSLGHPLASYIH